MRRRVFLSGAAVLAQSARSQQRQPSPAAAGVFLERPVAGQPHKGKVLLAIQPHSDDIPLSAAGTVAKLIQEGYTGWRLARSPITPSDTPTSTVSPQGAAGLSQDGGLAGWKPLGTSFRLSGRRDPGGDIPSQR